MLACHVSTLEGRIYEQRILFRILALFWWPIVNREVAQLISAFAHCQLVNSCFCEAQKMIPIIESDTPFDVIFIYFGGSRGHPIL